MKHTHRLKWISSLMISVAVMMMGFEFLTLESRINIAVEQALQDRQRTELIEFIGEYSRTHHQNTLNNDAMIMCDDKCE